VGGPDFDSETVIAYEIGYRAQFNSKITSSVSVFYNVYDKIRSTSPSPPPAILSLPLFYENNLEGETYGLELALTYQVSDWWRMVGGYTFFREDIRIKEGKTDFNNALNETADPRHRFLLQSFMNLNQKFTLDTRLRFVDSFVYSNSGIAETVPDYTELEIRLGYSPTKNLEFAIAGQNLLNKQHKEYVISSPNPRVEIERSVYLKASCRF
jgi:iron complex outermembrane receptor protein